VTSADAGTGIPGADVAFAWAAGLGAFFGVMSVGIMALRWLYQTVQVLESIHEDFMGEPARPGVPERPGVMVRMLEAEKALKELCTRMQGLERMVASALLGNGHREQAPATEGPALRAT